MMFYRRRASPKHRYDMIEVDYGGGGTAYGYEIKRSIVVSMGCPPLPYIKGGEEERASQGGGAP